MRKVSEVLRTVVSDPRYLGNDRRHDTTPYLCKVIHWRMKEGYVSEEEAEALYEAMQIRGYGTLLNKLEEEMPKPLPLAIEHFMNEAIFGYGKPTGPKGLPNDLRLQYWTWVLWDLTRKGQ